VTLGEAFAELGIDLDASPDQARRAYLRLLKTRKPEVDPQGFMRLREAYDLAKRHVEMHATLRRIMEGGADPAEAPPIRPARAPETSGPAPAASGLAPAASGPAPEASGPAPAASGPEPAASGPEPEASEEGPAPSAEPEIPPAAAEAPPAEAEIPSAEDDDAEAPPSMAAFELFLARGAKASAARELARIFEAAAHDVVGPPPPLHKAIHLLVVLNGDDEAGPARVLAESVAGWLRVSGQEARLLRGDAAVRWAVARELSMLPEKFPSTVRVSIAHAALAGDLAQAKRELFAFQSRRPSAAMEAAGTLRRRAPTLAAALAESLDPPPEPARAPAASGGNGFRGVWAIVVVAMGLMRILMATSSSSSHTPSFDPSRYTPRYTPPSFSFDGGFQIPARPALDDKLKKRALFRVDRMLSHVAFTPDAGAVSKGRRDPAAAKLASELADELEREDCTAARASARVLRARFVPDAGRASDEIGRVEALTLEQAVNAYCDALDRSRRPPEPESP